ncbi:MAG: ABC-2 transporter permease [Eubacteriales bacterium]|nr:ABC-2 transporter permease [Eubacteriales bacterium]
MLGKLLKKEWTLCMHPAAWIMLGLAVLILIPNYPYTVSFFYMTLGLFFICMSARENHDVTFTLTLPVEKRAVVTARICFAVELELLSLLLAGGMIIVHRALISTANGAGMEANVALLGEGFLLYGVFHLIFFPAHFKDVSRVGTPFVLASAALFALITADVVLSYALPFWRDVLDTPDPANLGAKLVFLLICIVFYALATLLALRRSQHHFLQLDIR